MPHLFIFHLLPVISNKLDGGMLNQITKCVAEKLIKQGKSSLSASIRNLADNSESEKNLQWPKEIKQAEFCEQHLKINFFLSYTGDLDLSYSILSHLTKVPRFSTISMFLTSAEKKGKPRFVHVSLLNDSFEIQTSIESLVFHCCRCGQSIS